MNRKGLKADKLTTTDQYHEIPSEDLLKDNNLNRFDNTRPKKRYNKNSRKKNGKKMIKTTRITILPIIIIFLLTA